MWSWRSVGRIRLLPPVEDLLVLSQSLMDDLTLSTNGPGGHLLYCILACIVGSVTVATVAPLDVGTLQREQQS